MINTLQYSIKKPNTTVEYNLQYLAHTEQATEYSIKRNNKVIKQ